MKIKGKWNWSANIKITAFDLDGNIKSIEEFHNEIHNVGVNMVRDFFDGDVADGEIKQLGIGTSNAAIDLTDTQMGNEIFRKAMTTQVDGGTGELVSTVYVAPAEAVFAIKELGWFAGDAAAASPNYNTGIMVSRVLYTRNKTALESLQIERADTIAEA